MPQVKCAGRTKISSDMPSWNFPALSQLAAIVLLALGSRALGDVVILRNGREVQGEVLREDGDRVVVRFPGGLLDLRRKDIASIQRQPRALLLIEEGDKRLLRGEHRSAIEAYSEALKEDSTSSRANQGLLVARQRHAEALFAQGRFEASREAYRQILAERPGDPAAVEGMASAGMALEEGAILEQRALDELRGGRSDAAIERLEELYEQFTERRPHLGRLLANALLQQGGRLLRAGKLDEADAAYRRALVLDPELVAAARRPVVELKMRQVGALASAGEYARLRDLTAAGLEVDPAHPALRFFHGLGLEGLGEARKASREYLEVLGPQRGGYAGKPIADLRRAAEEAMSRAVDAPGAAHPASKQALSGEFRELATEHFRVLHKNPAVASEAAAAAETAYRAIFDALGCATHLRTPLRLKIFPTREEYLAESGLGTWSSGAHRVERLRGDFSEHIIQSFQDEPRLLTGVVPHEVAHALLAHRLNYPSSLALWANEGFAVSCEPAYLHRHYDRVLSWALAREELLPFDTLLKLDAYPSDGVQVYYAQCYSLVAFLLSEGSLSTFVDFLKQASDAPEAWRLALRRHYAIADTNALEGRWRSWLLHRLAGEGGR